MQQYVGDYFSKEWAMKNVLQFDNDTIEEMKKQIGEEQAAGEIEDKEADEREEAPAEAPAKQSIDINVKSNGD